MGVKVVQQIQQMQTIIYESGSRYAVGELDQDGLVSAWRAAIGSGSYAVQARFDIGRLNLNERSLHGRAPIHLACAEGSIGTIKLLIELGANPNLVDAFGCTPLTYAVELGRADVVRLLLQYKPDVNRREHSRAVGFSTPLTTAVANGYARIVKLLLDAGANPNFSPAGRGTPLELAIATSDIQMASLLLEYKAEVNAINIGIPLMMAINTANEEMIKLLLRHGADPIQPVPNFLRCSNQCNRRCTPLKWASAMCSSEIVVLLLANCQPGSAWISECLFETVRNEELDNAKLLLDAGADINYESDLGHTALAGAVMTENTEVVRWVLDCGADPTKILRVGYLPLSEAASAKEDDPTIAKMLIERGADVNMRYRDDETALDTALHYNNPKIADLLRKHGAKTRHELIADQKPEPSSVPPAPVPVEIVKTIPTLSLEDELFKAISTSDTSATKTALSKGASLTCLNAKQHTPLIASVKKRNAQFVKLLLDHKACTEDREPKVGMTPLMMAVKEGHSSISSLLIHAGADINATDWNGNSVLRHAMEGGNFKIIEMLISGGSDTERQNNKGVSPLAWATKNRKNEILKLIDERKLSDEQRGMS